ncbi:hypothetical protein [Pseudoalteromonas sp. MMG024]|uniref:hypothetical protein n=1 Tax=Pseudoalteromonas sp. MMG024 TaxID=2909980 RepID=UPI001F4682A9|nr:hypothetical protein [Pseudoalteromonas sp. MMG024]MCF6457150.1 hypothetical protein [Pseudoalteromonas sp. MMG024]
MTFLLYTSACLLLLVSLAHSYLGERYILIRLFKRDNLPKLFGNDDFTKRTLRFAWHLTSVTWVGFAAILLVLAEPNLNKVTVLYIIAVTFAIYFIVALVGSKAKHLSWILFAVVSALTMVAANG